MTITSVSSVAIVGISISRPLAIIAVVTISAIAIATISAIAIARLSSSGSLGFPLAIVSMAVAVTIPAVAIAMAVAAVAIARLCNNHSEEGEGKKGQEFHGVFSSSFSETPH